MKRMICIVFWLMLLPSALLSQPIKGIIYADTGNILVVKVWGTHQERGYALGYLTGDRITDIITNYVIPKFSGFYLYARNIIIQGNDISIPQNFQDEAQAVIDGMNAAGTNLENLDKTDILVGNCLLDLVNLMALEGSMNCSALMSWNSATAGTELDGKSVITRHLDWEISTVLSRNHIIVVHFPSESSESKWLLTGFSGMLSNLSGFNPDFGAFMNVMDDYSTHGSTGKHYLPIWFALRKAVEAADYNGDGLRNVQDVRSALRDCAEGVASGCIVSSLARSAGTDSLVALVAELTPTVPMHTFRYSTYPDSIPGQNLYTANYQIARNNMMHFCARYNGIRNHIGNGTLIGLDTSWSLMKTWSSLSNNCQFMQYAPEMNWFRIAVSTNGQPAYLCDPVVFDLGQLFADPSVGISEGPGASGSYCFPNPATSYLRIHLQGNEPASLEIFDVTGRLIRSHENYISGQAVDISYLERGSYMVRIKGGSRYRNAKFIKL